MRNRLVLCLLPLALACSPHGRMGERDGSAGGSGTDAGTTVAPDGGTGCSAGSTKACTCPGGAIGEARCEADGSGYGTCLCSGVEASAGSLVLGIHRARRATGALLEVNLTLANGTGGAAVPLNPLLFQVQTSAGLIYEATLSQPRWLDGDNCDAAVSLAGGASFSCNVEFDIPGGATPVSITYRTPGAVSGVGEDKRTASTPCSVEPCTQCGDVCTYLDRDPNNCGSCGEAAVSDYGAVCRNGHVACTDSSKSPCPQTCAGCPVTCESLSTEWNCGGCGIRVPSGGICDAGVPKCPQRTSLCNQTCVDLQTDPKNCGECGKTVPTGLVCRGGVPQCSDPSLSICGTTCVDLDAGNLNCGSCGVTCDTANGFACDSRRCRGAFSFSTYTPGVTCSQICGAAGYRCDPSSAPYLQYSVASDSCSWVQFYSTCDAVIAQTVQASTFGGCPSTATFSRVTCHCMN